MSFDKIFDLTAGVCFNIFNMFVFVFQQKNMTPAIEKKLTHIVYYKYQQRSLQR